MIKLAGRILDQYDDPNFVQNPQRAALGLPDSSDIAGLPDREFGIVIKTASGRHRRYPLATPTLLKLSAAYFRHYGHQLPDEMRKAVGYHIKEAGVRLKVDLPDLGADVASGYPGHVFTSYGEPMPVSVGMTKEAAGSLAQDEFLANYGRMTPAERAMAASHLSKVAEITDHRVRDYVPKDTYGPRFQEGVEQRASLLRDDSIKLAQLQSLVSSVKHMDPSRGAVCLHHMDKFAGLEGRVLDAFQTCWGGFEKSAEPMDRQFGIGKLSAETYRIETLARAHGEIIRQVFSEDIASAFLRNPIGFYESQSGQVKQTLKTLANAVGEKNPRSEVHTEAIPYARGQIRSGDFTPWSKC